MTSIPSFYSLFPLPLRAFCYDCKMCILKTIQIAKYVFKSLKTLFNQSFHFSKEKTFSIKSCNSNKNLNCHSDINFNLKGKIDLYSEFPTEESIFQNIPVAKEFGKHLVDLSKVILKPEDIDEILTFSAKGVILFALLSLRAIIFHPKPLHFYNFQPSINSNNHFQVPKFFSYQKKELATQIYELKKEFNQLTETEKEIIIDHIDSEIKTTDSKQYFLVSKISTTTVENNQKSPIFSKKAKDVYQNIHAIANRLHVSNPSFSFTLCHSLNP